MQSKCLFTLNNLPSADHSNIKCVAQTRVEERRLTLRRHHNYKIKPFDVYYYFQINHRSLFFIEFDAKISSHSMLLNRDFKRYASIYYAVLCALLDITAVCSAL